MILKVKEKMINSLNEIVKNKTENGKELFPNLSDLDLFLDKVSEYNKVSVNSFIHLDQEKVINNRLRFDFTLASKKYKLYRSRNRRFSFKRNESLISSLINLRIFMIYSQLI